MSHQRADFSHTVVFPMELEHLWEAYRQEYPQATFNGMSRSFWLSFLSQEKAATEEPDPTGTIGA